MFYPAMLFIIWWILIMFNFVVFLGDTCYLQLMTMKMSYTLNLDSLIYVSCLAALYKKSILTLSTIDTWGWRILCCGRLSCALWDVRQHLGPLATRCQQYSGPQGCDNQKCLQTLKNVTWEAKLLPVENHWSEIQKHGIIISVIEESLVCLWFYRE